MSSLFNCPDVCCFSKVGQKSLCPDNILIKIRVCGRYDKSRNLVYLEYQTDEVKQKIKDCVKKQYEIYGNGGDSRVHNAIPAVAIAMHQTPHVRGVEAITSGIRIRALRKL